MLKILKRLVIKKCYFSFRLTVQQDLFMSDNSLKKGRYTRYSNKIGLYSTSQDRIGFLNNNTDVVLSFPFKDTVLEAGMNKEDSGREERFLHLEVDGTDIDTLFEPKVLTNIKYSGIQEFRNSGKAIEFFDENGNLQQNLLIKGNNLLALYSLREKLAGKVKLIYIDPPYNTENDSFQYNDSFNHSSWLIFMKNRLEVAKELLSDDGSIFVHCDDNELGYLRVLMDEIFGRSNFISQINIDARSPSAFSTVNLGVFKASEYMLWFAKSRTNFTENRCRVARTPDYAYDKWLENPEDNMNEWRFISVVDAYSKNTNQQNKNPLTELKNFNKFILNNADRICRLASISDSGAGQAILELKENSLNKPNTLFYLKRDNGLDDVHVINGQQLIFYKKNVSVINGELAATKLLTNVWTDIAWEGIAKEGGAKFKKGKKPETLIQRIIALSTVENDIVLDFCLGSGTTCAVAHKMNRRWIGIEQMDYIEDITLQRLKKVIEGEQSGISKAVNWQGGGSFIYFELKKYNQDFLDKITAANNKGELDEVYNDMARNAFLKFWFDKNEFEKDENFRSLDLDQRKKLLIGILDENQLYLNYADMRDSRYHVTDEEMALTDQFYGANND